MRTSALIVLPLLALTACAQATPTPAPSPTPTPPPAHALRVTATPTPVPTAAPTPLGSSREASDYTEDEIAEAAGALHREFTDAINRRPGPDLQRAKATYSEACQPDDEEFATQIDSLLALLDGRELSIEVIAASRLPDHDDAAIIAAFPLLDGERLFGLTRSLAVFENGRWLDSDCEEGRAAFLEIEPDDANGYGESDGSATIGK